jgi:hypothetical protein
MEAMGYKRFHVDLLVLDTFTWIPRTEDKHSKFLVSEWHGSTPNGGYRQAQIRRTEYKLDHSMREWYKLRIGAGRQTPRLTPRARLPAPRFRRPGGRPLLQPTRQPVGTEHGVQVPW